jgi:hypothetical protein
VQNTIKQCKELKQQISSYTSKQGKDIDTVLKKMCDSITKQLNAIEEPLYQSKAKAGQDLLNYPIKLNDKLSGIYGDVDGSPSAPTEQHQKVFDLLCEQCTPHFDKLEAIKKIQLPILNNLIKQSALPIIKAN